VIVVLTVQKEVMTNRELRTGSYSTRSSNGEGSAPRVLVALGRESSLDDRSLRHGQDTGEQIPNRLARQRTR